MKGFFIGILKRMLQTGICFIVMKSGYYSSAHQVTNYSITLHRDKKNGHLMSNTMGISIVRPDVVFQFILAI